MTASFSEETRNLFSTNLNARFLRSLVIPKQEVFIGKQRLEYLDWFNAAYSLFIKQVKNYIPHIYRGYEPITTLSYQYYQTTSLYWAIVFFNDIIDPFDIAGGQIIKIPDYGEIQQFMANLNSNKLRQTSTSTVTL